MNEEGLTEWIDYYPDAYPQLILVHQGVTLNLLNEDILSFARIQVSEKEITRTYSGHTIVADRCTTDKYQWTLSLSLGISQTDKLRAIYQRSNTARKSPPRTGYEVVFSDIAEPVLEEAVNRTNAVPTWVQNVEGLSKYFAVFSVLIEDFSTLPNGIGYDCELTLIEV